MQKINTSMGFKQSFIIFLFTPIALVIAIVAATCGWKPAFNETNKRGVFSHNGKKYIQIFGSCWEMSNQKNQN